MALTDNLVSYWQMAEASGNALDSHGSSPLTLVGTAASVAGKLGNARNLSAAVPPDHGFTRQNFFPGGDYDYTIGGWFYFTSVSGTRTLIGYGSDQSGDGHYALNARSSTQKFSFVAYNAAGAATTITADLPTPVATGQWYFVLGWHDEVAGTINIQVNNGTVYSAAFVQTHKTGNGWFTVGGEDDSSPGTLSQDMLGYVDDCFVLTRVLTSDERTQIYGAGSGLAWPWPSVAAPSTQPIGSSFPMTLTPEWS